MKKYFPLFIQIHSDELFSNTYGKLSITFVIGLYNILLKSIS